MILRPESDAELIDRGREILSDSAVPLDTRAMIALLILSKGVKSCPAKSKIAAMVGGPDEKIGAQRIQRMFRDAERAGYFVRERGRLDGVHGRAGRYWFIVGAGRTP